MLQCPSVIPSLRLLRISFGDSLFYLFGVTHQVKYSGHLMKGEGKINLSHPGGTWSEHQGSSGSNLGQIAGLTIKFTS